MVLYFPLGMCLSLPLFVLRVLFVDYIELSLPAHNFALRGTLFQRGTYFHDRTFLFVTETDPSFG